MKDKKYRENEGKYLQQGSKQFELANLEKI